MPRPVTAAEVITALQLEPLPGEGGFFRVTSRRPAASAIFFLLTRRDFSALHRIAQDEMWHFYAGDAVEQVQFDAGDRRLQRARMGPDVLAGDQPQVLVPAGAWQGARLDPAAAGAGFALLGCTVAPPWDERGFELGLRDRLLAEFPAHANWVRALTR